MKNIITLGSFYSWEIVSEKTVIKTIDRSIILSKGSALPSELKEFWEVENLDCGQSIKINIHYKNEIFEARLRTGKKEKSRIGKQTKISWKRPLADEIEKILPDAVSKFDNGEYTKDFAPKMKFTKLGQGEYELEFIKEDVLDIDIKEELSIPSIELEGLTEGEKLYRINKFYERNPKNREEAIKHHGVTCSICGFNFEKEYGELGKDYIEIHHKTPLYTLDKEVIINPEEDLIPVCANCHRMIHRDRENFKTIEEIKNLMKSKN